MSKEVFKGYDTSAKKNVMQILKMINMKEKGKCSNKKPRIILFKAGIYNVLYKVKVMQKDKIFI